MAITADTELGATKADILTAIVQRELIAKSKFASTILDVSGFAIKGAKTISFPKYESFVAADRVSGVEGVPQALTFSQDTMLLDKTPYVSWLVDTQSEVQSNVNVELENAKRAATAHSKRVDTDIIAKIEEVAFVGTASLGDITRDIILEFRRKLRINEADMDNVTLAISPEQEEAMLKIAEFTRADAFGSSNIPGGVIGMCFGVPIMISNNLSGQSYYMYEKECAAIGFQRSPAIDEQKAIGYGTGAMLKAMDQLYGTMGLQLGLKGVAGTESPLACKDANV